MADYQILSDKELQIAPVGLYCVAGEDGAPIDTVRDFYDIGSDQFVKDAPLRLVARVGTPQPEIPKGIEGIIARADGLQIVTAWALAALLDAADNSGAVPVAEPIDPVPVDLGVDVPVVPEPVPTDVPIIAYPACPNCGASLTNAVIQSLTVCPNCGRTIALSDDTAAVATSAQTVDLSPATIKQLKQLRPKR